MVKPNTVKTSIELKEEVDKKFRMAVATTKGFRKGALGEAIEEAIEDWIKKNQGARK